MRLLKRNNFDFGDITDSISSKLEDLQPLADTMSNALKSVGIQPPSELGALTQSFNSNIAAPAQGFAANPIENVLNYVTKQMTSAQSGQQLNKTQQIVANGGQRTLTNLQNQSALGDLFSNPITWVVIVGLVGLALWLKFKR